MGWNELKIDIFFFHEGCEVGRAFIVEEGDHRCKTAVNKLGMNRGEGFGEVVITSAF